MVRKMSIRKLNQSEDAVVGIVVTVLLIGLAVSVSVMVNNVYMPRWVEEIEVSHMEDVANQFAMLKYALDIQAAMQENTAISSSITLGSKSLPILDVGKSFGTLQISEDQCRCIIRNESGGEVFNGSAGMIKYSSGNSYYVHQDYVYQGGALILSQPPDDMLIGKPSFVVTDYTDISFVLVNITTTEGKSFASGDGTYPIHTEYIASPVVKHINNVTNITIYTNYPNSWRIAFESTFKQSDNPFSSDDVSMSGNRVIAEFPTDRANGLDLRYVEVLAQVSPGWIE